MKKNKPNRTHLFLTRFFQSIENKYKYCLGLTIINGDTLHFLAIYPWKLIFGDLLLIFGNWFNDNIIPLEKNIGRFVKNKCDQKVIMELWMNIKKHVITSLTKKNCISQEKKVRTSYYEVCQKSYQKIIDLCVIIMVNFWKWEKLKHVPNSKYRGTKCNFFLLNGSSQLIIWIYLII